MYDSNTMCGEDACCDACNKEKAAESLAYMFHAADYGATVTPGQDDEEEVVGEEDFGAIQYPESFEAYTNDDSDGMADWVNPEDRIPLKLAISLYTQPLEEYRGYKLFGSYARSGAWYSCETQTVIVGLRGTQVGVTGGLQDLLDDVVSF